MKPFVLLFIGALAVLTGCSGVQTKPAPVRDASSSPAPAKVQPAPTPEVEVYAYRAPQRSAFRSDSPVLALVRQAGDQQRAGRLDAAAASLERALRIEPRNAHLWNRLARVRLEQGRYGQAGSMAAKSNALAGDSPSLKADNQHIIQLAGKAGNP